MRASRKIAFFGSSLVSAYWNGAATYYRGILRALHTHGYDITFYEPEIADRQAHRDIPDPPWARVSIYPPTPDGVQRALEQARQADIIVKGSSVGVFDEFLEAHIPHLSGAGRAAVFWDVDAPAMMDRIEANDKDPFREQLPYYDLVLTCGGPALVEAYLRHGARECVSIYHALDPATHFPVPSEARLAGDLGFLGNRLDDREIRMEEFFFRPARRLPLHTFVLGGLGWHSDPTRHDNLHYLGHVYTRDHNAFHCSMLAVISVNGVSRANHGHIPPARLFEAVGAGACVLSDIWVGLEEFLEPQREVFPVSSAAEVGSLLPQLTPRQAKRIGRAARRRVLAHHTYAHRAALLSSMLEGRTALSRPSKSFATVRYG